MCFMVLLACLVREEGATEISTDLLLLLLVLVICIHLSNGLVKTPVGEKHTPATRSQRDASKGHRVHVYNTVKHTPLSHHSYCVQLAGKIL